MATQCEAQMDNRFGNGVPSSNSRWAGMVPPCWGEVVLLWSGGEAKRRASALPDWPRPALTQNKRPHRHNKLVNTP